MGTNVDSYFSDVEKLEEVYTVVEKSVKENHIGYVVLVKKECLCLFLYFLWNLVSYGKLQEDIRFLYGYTGRKVEFSAYVLMGSILL